MVVLAYLVWTCRYPTNAVTHSPWRLPRPTSRVAIAQIALASADWLVTGAVLYLFVPFGLTAGVWPFLATYAIAQAVAMVSHVPAGAGVLELMLVGLLAADAPPPLVPLCLRRSSCSGRSTICFRSVSRSCSSPARSSVAR
jgi:phosphatidylglycerol lysyltransferase